MEYKNLGMGFGREDIPEKPEEAETFLNKMRPLVEELHIPDGEIKTKEAIESAKVSGFLIDTPVKIPANPEIGKIVGYNEATDGFYPGSRYPILVKFNRGTFEYSPKDLIIIKE